MICGFFAMCQDYSSVPHNYFFVPPNDSFAEPNSLSDCPLAQHPLESKLDTLEKFAQGPENFGFEEVVICGSGLDGLGLLLNLLGGGRVALLSFGVGGSGCWFGFGVGVEWVGIVCFGLDCLVGLGVGSGSVLDYDFLLCMIQVCFNLSHNTLLY